MKTESSKTASVKPVIVLLWLALSVAIVLRIGLAYPSRSVATTAT
jgi:hypothetical protein